MWSESRPGRFTPGKDPVPIAQEAGWALATRLKMTYFYAAFSGNT
jgi:hypothetical protein